MDQDREFDAVIEALQDILMDDKFIRIHRAFLDKHCAEFEDTEENKLCYTSLFREYVTCIGEFRGSTPGMESPKPLSLSLSLSLSLTHTHTD
jgi:hypothetical protein